PAAPCPRSWWRSPAGAAGTGRPGPSASPAVGLLAAVGSSHRQYIETPVQFLLADPVRHVAAVEDGLADRLLLRQRLLRHLRGGLVADRGVQRRDDRRRGFRLVAQMVDVRLESGDA